MAIVDQLRAFLRAYGLEELADAAATRFLDGMPSSSELELWLEEQPVVQREFSAVFERRKAGLPPISIADVVDYRRQATQYAAYYDLPPEFIDVNKLIVNDVSASELGERIQGAAEIVNANPLAQAQAQAWGYSTGDLISLALDPDSGMAAVRRRQSSIKVGAQATRQGFSLTEGEAGGLVDQGVTDSQADQGFATLAKYGEVTKQLEGEATGPLSREDQLGVVAGKASSTQALQDRSRRRTSVFEEGGGLAAGQGGVFGAGTAGGR